MSINASCNGLKTSIEVIIRICILITYLRPDKSRLYNDCYYDVGTWQWNWNKKKSTMISLIYLIECKHWQWIFPNSAWYAHSLFCCTSSRIHLFYCLAVLIQRATFWIVPAAVFVQWHNSSKDRHRGINYDSTESYIMIVMV